MEEDRRCNTCIHYDPEEGYCEELEKFMHGYDGRECDRWEDWENKFYGGKA